MTIKEQLVAKAEALRLVQDYIRTLTDDEKNADNVYNFIESVIDNYKKLVVDTNQKAPQ